MIKISESILNLKPYVPGKSIEEVEREYGIHNIIKLASNENPLGPSPLAVEAIKKVVSEIHRYPDGSYFNLKKAFSEHYQIPSKNISCGNGSNELIDLLIRIFCKPGDKILISEAAFVAYKVCALASRVSVTEVPLLKDFSMDIDKLLHTWTPEHKLIFLPNPNNPTGRYINKNQFEKILQKLGNSDECYLVLDEAYVEFVRAKDYPNGLDYFKKFKNIIVLRTQAKVYGLAGLRLGTMIAPLDVVDLVERVRNPFNVNSIVVAAAQAALSDREYVKKSQTVVWQGLDYFYEQLEKMGISYCESQGNFVFFDTQKDSQSVFEKLLSKGVILRPVKNYGFNTHLRMSVGLPQENEKAILCLKEIL